MSTATTGTGTITLGSAVTGFLSFAASGVQDGDIVSYGIQDGANSEAGRGTYTASGTTLTRSVLTSTNSNNAISLSGQAEVYVTVVAQDLYPAPVLNGGTGLSTITAYNLLIGSTNQTSVTVLAPSATTDTPLISQGSSANPAYSKLRLTNPATAATLTVADTKTATFNKTQTYDGVDGITSFFNNTLTYTGVDGSTIIFNAGGTVIYGTRTIATTSPLTGGGNFSADRTLSITGAAGQLLAGSGPAFTATPILGVGGTTKGILGLAGNTSGTVLLQPAAAAGSWSLTFPASGGSSGNILQTDGAGVTTWAAAGGGSGTVAAGTAGQIAYYTASTNSVSGVNTTGSGTVVALSIAPAFTTPTLGVATATSLNKLVITPPATAATLTVADGKGAAISNSLTFSGTDGSAIAAGGGGSILYSNASTTTTVGYLFTSFSGGTISSGAYTPAAGSGNYQYYVNNGAHTLAVPAADSALDILVTNAASAGSITFSGYSVGSSTGDSLTTTNTNKFIISVRKINGSSTYTIKAMQ